MRAHLEQVIVGLLEATEMEEMERTRAELEARRNRLNRRVAV
jgi:GntR family transcriptional repressor for pyruvate dehydrogenase complex